MSSSATYFPTYRANAELSTSLVLNAIDLRSYNDVSFSLRVTSASNDLDFTAKITACDFATGDFADTGVDIRITDNGTYNINSQVKPRYARVEITRTAGSCTMSIAATVKGA